MLSFDSVDMLLKIVLFRGKSSDGRDRRRSREDFCCLGHPWGVTSLSADIDVLVERVVFSRLGWVDGLDPDDSKTSPNGSS